MFPYMYVGYDNDTLVLHREHEAITIPSQTNKCKQHTKNKTTSQPGRKENVLVFGKKRKKRTKRLQQITWKSRQEICNI